MNWLAHVANHRSAALWRLHALHHSQEDMSVFTTFRTHPLAHASYLPALLPALVLGASGPVPASALIVYGCLVTLPHANLRWTFGPLGRILVSPAYHRLHHARTPLDSRGAVNFGFVLVCWDRMARRAAFPTGEEPILTGIDGPTGPHRAGRPHIQDSCGRAGPDGAAFAWPTRPRTAPRERRPDTGARAGQAGERDPGQSRRSRCRPARRPDRPGLDLHLSRRRHPLRSLRRLGAPLGDHILRDRRPPPSGGFLGGVDGHHRTGRRHRRRHRSLRSARGRRSRRRHGRRHGDGDVRTTGSSRAPPAAATRSMWRWRRWLSSSPCSGPGATLDTVIRSMARRTSPNRGDPPRSGPPASDPARAGLYEVESSRGDS